MARIFAVVKKVVAGVAGAVNFRAPVTPGVHAGTVVGVLAGTEVAAAVALPATVGTLLPEATKPAGRLAVSVVGDVLPDVKPAPAVGSVLTLAPSQRPAGNLVQMTWGLDHESGGNTHVDSGPQAFTNPANATGSTDGVFATRAGQALAVTDFSLTLSYANFLAKTALTITLVRLHFYVRMTGSLVNPTTNLRYDLGAGMVLLETIVGNFTNIAPSPRIYDITAAVGGDWSKLDALTTQVDGHFALGEAAALLSVDAVYVEVVAAVTDAL